MGFFLFKKEKKADRACISTYRLDTILDQSVQSFVNVLDGLILYWVDLVAMLRLISIKNCIASSSNKRALHQK